MTGLAFGKPRNGVPKTEEERLATHRQLYGDDNLPPRGTGLYRYGGLSGVQQTTSISWPSVIMGCVMGYSLYPAIKHQKAGYEFILGVALGCIGYALHSGKSLKQVGQEALSPLGLNLSKGVSNGGR